MRPACRAEHEGADEFGKKSSQPGRPFSNSYVRSPSPCARQENSGDCELETLAKEAGVGTPRFPRRTISRGHDDSSLAIAVDHDACILCDRCIAAATKSKTISSSAAWAKGYSAGVAFDLNAPMGDSTCISAANVWFRVPRAR